MYYINDYISGDKFLEFSKTYDWLFFIKDFNNVNKIKKDIPMILITHNGDQNINNHLINKIGEIPDNIIKWYAQNIDYEHGKLESIPIGLENSYNFPDLRKIEKMKIKLKEEKNIKNLLYINFDVDTNLSERFLLSKMFTKFQWATSKLRKNGNNFEEYLDDIYNHKFILSPPGNGIDTHRTWECLYMNSIPVVKRCKNTKYYEDLPICFVNNWTEINENFLNNEYDRIKNSKWNFEKLTMEYWKNKIIKNYENFNNGGSWL